MSKVKQIQDIFKTIDPSIALIEEAREGGGSMLIGPFPSFIIMLDIPGQPDGYIISVNADAPNLVFFFARLLKEYPELEHYGPYAEDQETNSIIGGQEAYKSREELIVRQAVALLKQRKEATETTSPGGLCLLNRKLF